MRVLFATNHVYLPQRSGGSESSTHDLCTALLKTNNSVGVLCCLDPTGFLGLVNRIKRRFKYQSYPKDRVMGYPVYRGWAPVKNGVDEVLKDFDPSVAVIQAGAPMELVEVFLAKKVPTVLYLRDVEFDKMGGTLFEDPFLLYIANSNFTALKTKEVFNINCHVIPPLVNPDKYVTPTTRRNVVFVCPFPGKGLEIALALAGARPDIPFVFVESWPLSEARLFDLKERIKGMVNVQLRRSVADMREIYRDAKLLLVPSIWNEAWGRVVTEAHFSGIPVLASNRGGLPESVGSGGVLVNPDSPVTEWLAALSFLWDNENNYDAAIKATVEFSRRQDIKEEKIIGDFVSILNMHVNMCSNFDPGVMGYELEPLRK